jgi:hypothetical protein
MNSEMDNEKETADPMEDDILKAIKTLMQEKVKLLDYLILNEGSDC